MSHCPFCSQDPTVPAPPPRTSNLPKRILRRAWRAIQWLIPSTILLLLPKCPLCIAAYLAIFTTLEIEDNTARWIHILTRILCWTSLTYLTAALLYRWQKSRTPKSPTMTR